MRVGVLALQGDVREHICALQKCGVETVEVRRPEDMDNIYGLVIPGGESTTIGKLMVHNKLDVEILRKHEHGMPIYGTCAGAILLAKHIVGSRQHSLGLMDISVKRNSYGRQSESFETNLVIDGFLHPLHAIFIRAPLITEVHNGAQILAEFKDSPVLIRQGNLLASTFHPELTGDYRIHQYFVDMIQKSRSHWYV
ncbi:MAG TPA: pyridoxal 5'-phosphate synthase glutaminase subunit PdxT [Candidatus Nanoarchaeia archaeon]|nr:pyridoxal 5'-phosphate synthase glutaminase subunit PdxT [Candidatus Nanoarchaeia archaeon]